MQLRNRIMNGFSTFYGDRSVLPDQSEHTRGNAFLNVINETKRKMKGSYSRIALFLCSNYSKTAVENKLYDADCSRKQAQRTWTSKLTAFFENNYAFIKEKKDSKDSLILRELKETKRQLDIAYINFDYVIDPDMIDSSIYQMNAISNRYRFLLKQIKVSEGAY